MNKKNKMGLILALAGLAGNVMAGTLSSFTTGDLLICFRNGNDLVVDAGPITGSSLIGSPIGSTNNITAYTAANFDTISLNGLNWSAIAYGSDGSLYITKAREDLNQYDANYLVSSPSMQSSRWNPVGGNPSQQLTGPVGSMVAGAARALTSGYYSGNSATAVYEPGTAAGHLFTFGTGQSYGDIIDPNGLQAYNYGVFQGDPEFTTLGTFTTDGIVSRSDLYQISGDGSTVTWLGYLQLSPSTGLMTFVHAPDTTPVITKVTRAAGVTTISYTTGLTGTYTLQATNSAGLTAPKSTWPVIATLSNGDLLTHTITDTDTTSANKFYIITGN